MISFSLSLSLILITSPQCLLKELLTGFLTHYVTGAGGPEPAQRYIPVNDNLYNVTGRNISDWLVKTMEQYMMRRFVAATLGINYCFMLLGFLCVYVCVCVCVC